MPKIIEPDNSHAAISQRQNKNDESKQLGMIESHRSNTSNTSSLKIPDHAPTSEIKPLEFL